MSLYSDKARRTVSVAGGLAFRPVPLTIAEASEENPFPDRKERRARVEHVKKLRRRALARLGRAIGRRYRRSLRAFVVACRHEILRNEIKLEADRSDEEARSPIDRPARREAYRLSQMIGRVPADKAEAFAMRLRRSNEDVAREREREARLERDRQRRAREAKERLDGLVCSERRARRPGRAHVRIRAPRTTASRTRRSRPTASPRSASPPPTDGTQERGPPGDGDAPSAPDGDDEDDGPPAWLVRVERGLRRAHRLGGRRCDFCCAPLRGRADVACSPCVAAVAARWRP